MDKTTAPVAPLSADAIITAARENAKPETLANGAQVIVVPTGSKLVELTKAAHGLLPTRLIAERTFHDGDSFARYVKRYTQAGSQLIADIDASRVTAILDYPDENEAMFNEDGDKHDAESIPSREHKAVWPVEHSEAFATWLAINAKFLPQDLFLAFLEENVGDIAQPDPATILTLVRDFAAIKTEKFERSTRLQNGDASLIYVNETNVRQDLVVPRKITLRMPIYHGEEEVEFDAWFRYRVANGGLAIQIEFHRIEPVKQAAFRAAVAKLHDRGCALDAFYGIA